MTIATTDTLQFTPGYLDYSTESDYPITFDVAAPLASFTSRTATDPFASLIDLSDGTVIDVPVSPTVIGADVILLQLPGTILTARHHYRLVVGFTCATTGAVVAGYVIVNVLF